MPSEATNDTAPRLAEAPVFEPGDFVWNRMDGHFAEVAGVDYSDPRSPTGLIRTTHHRDALCGGWFTHATPEFIQEHFAKARRLLEDQKGAVTSWEFRLRSKKSTPPDLRSC